MIRTNDSDWNRAFFARLLACLGTLPLIFAFGALVLLVPREGGGKETLIFLGSLCSGLLLATAFSLGGWRRRASYSSEKRWHMGVVGTAILGAELLLSLYLLLGNAWSAFHYFAH
jgi:hypothetical protein